MPNATLSIPKNATFAFLVKCSQDGIVIPPPGTIASSTAPANMLNLVRQVDGAGRAVYRVTGLNEGTATAEIGSGSGKLTIAATITPPAAGPIVFELDGDFLSV